MYNENKTYSWEEMKFRIDNWEKGKMKFQVDFFGKNPKKLKYFISTSYLINLLGIKKDEQNLPESIAAIESKKAFLIRKRREQRFFKANKHLSIIKNH